MVVLLSGMLATFTTFNSASHGTLTAQREQVAMTAAEQQMETLRAWLYTDLGLKSLPVQTGDGNAPTDHSGNPANPNYWVRGLNLFVPTDFNQETSPATGEPLVTTIAGAAKSDTISVGGYTASIYRYISSVTDTCPPPALVPICTSVTPDAKRITVAVVLNPGVGVGVLKPVWLSTGVAAPPVAP